jgi:hypothetical protein
MSTNPLLSSAISEQVPGFLRVDHPVFVSFLEAYYEYLESDNPKTATSFEDIKDVDKSLDIFIQNFKNEFLKDFPESLVVDPVTSRPVEQRKLIKNINSFYRSKGTPNAIKFLIRVLLDSNADIYEPSSDVFRISDGKYIVDKTIRTSSTQGQKLFSSIGKEIQQLADDNKTINSRAIVSTVNFFDTSFGTISEFFLKGVNGQNFESGKGIQFTDDNGNVVRERKVISGRRNITVDPQNRGTGYEIGDKLTIRASGDDKGINAKASVRKIGSNGELREIEIDDFGVNYEKNPDIIGIDTVFGAGGITGLTTTIGALCEYPGYYSSNDGLISTNKRIQDNKFYQNFSYVVRAEARIEDYRDALMKIAHPAGFGFFGQIRFIRCNESDVPNHNLVFSIKNKLIGNYAPYTNKTFDNLNTWFVDADGASAGYDPAVHDAAITGNLVSVPGNPVSSELFFEDFGTSPNALSGPGFGDEADPFYIIASHPNVFYDKKIQTGRLSSTFKDECFAGENADGTTGWREFHKVYGQGSIEGTAGFDGGATGWSADFTGKFADTTLMYFQGETEMRKIFIKSLIDADQSETPLFDCRRDDGYLT